MGIFKIFVYIFLLVLLAAACALIGFGGVKLYGTIRKRTSKTYGFEDEINFDLRNSVDKDLLGTETRSAVDGNNAADEFRSE